MKSLSRAAVLFAVFAVAATAWSLRTGALVNYGSGVWLALSTDAANGVFYRPLVSEIGFGGTRYFPLTFLLTGALIRAGIEPIAAGHLVSLLAALAFVAGAYRLLRALDVDRVVALASSALVLCTYAGIFALGTIRGDMLPAALNMWGLVFGSRLLLELPASTRLRTELAGAACFCLAFLAKPTTVFGLAAVATALLLAGGRRRAAAVRLVALTIVPALALLAAANVMSHGQMLESFRAAATGGGNLQLLAQAPLTFLHAAVRQDPMGIALLVLTMSATLALPRAAWRELPTLAVAYTLIAMIAIYGTPGVDLNHLVDFYAIALIFVVVQMGRHRLPGPATGVVLAVSAALSIVMLAGELRAEGASADVQQLRSVVAAVHEIDKEAGPIFAQSPLIPIMDGRRPYLLDPWMFRAIGRRDPRFRDTLATKVRDRSFGAVVLGGFVGVLSDRADPRTDRGLAIFADWFGREFLTALGENYELTNALPPYFVFRPKHSP